MSTRYLVTGGAGFIGSHLVDRLLAEDGGKARVAVVDNFNDHYDPAIKRSNVAAHADCDRFALIEADIRDEGRMRDVVASLRPEVIVHLAARTGIRASVENPFLYETTNVAGTLTLLEAARRAGTQRFVFGSSSSVYGVNERAPFRETDSTLTPASPYAATKIAAEALCGAYAHLCELSVVSLRFFSVFGPRQRPDLALRKFLDLMRAGQPIELYGDGTSCRDYTYVDDVVDAIMAAATLPEVRGHEVFNVGHATPTTLRDAVRALEEVSGLTAEIVWRPDQPGDVPRTHADLTRARERLGYTPRVSLREGIARMLAWLDRARDSSR